MTKITTTSRNVLDIVFNDVDPAIQANRMMQMVLPSLEKEFNFDNQNAVVGTGIDQEVELENAAGLLENLQSEEPEGEMKKLYGIIHNHLNQALQHNRVVVMGLKGLDKDLTGQQIEAIRGTLIDQENELVSADGLLEGLVAEEPTA